MDRRDFLKAAAGFFPMALGGLAASNVSGAVVRGDVELRVADGVKVTIVPEHPAEYEGLDHFAIGTVRYVDARGKVCSNAVASLVNAPFDPVTVDCTKYVRGKRIKLLPSDVSRYAGFVRKNL